MAQRSRMMKPGAIWLEGPGCWEGLRTWLEDRDPDGVFVLTDTHTARACLPVLDQRLGRDRAVLTIPAGEKGKTVETASLLWQALANAGAGRGSVLLNLGGGVVTDLGGFVASTYMRGISFVHIPTSLLAQVDAAIGGKNGIDVGHVKNLAGIFREPDVLLIDPIFLETLPQQEWHNGLAEVAKHALIADPDLWRALEGLEHPRDISQRLLSAAVAVKRMIVAEDPGESGLRKVLNFGHTVGHALESMALAFGQEWPHGEAVAAGMQVEAWLSKKLCGLPAAEEARIRIFLQRFFPDRPVPDPESCLSYIRKDKKNRGGVIRMALLQSIGKAIPVVEVPGDLVLAAMKECLGETEPRG